MLILPAIDLKGGKCVRLLRGDMQAETVYGDDPLAIGRRWVAGGAEYLHVVDLDGAVSGEPVNAEAIARLCRELPVPIEVGGGVRSVARAEALLGLGAARVIFGTAALRSPEVVREACRRFPDRIAVGIDARDGRVAVQGWVETSSTRAVDLAAAAEHMGASCIIYTDIERDGTEQGVNVAATRALAESVSIPVIASGGVGSLADVEALLPCETSGVTGVIVGRALYSGAVKLEDALRLTRKPRAES
jgi:phosphoribosylformimino-5-aminoimidazole carboxamide ribotide isomerase